MTDTSESPNNLVNITQKSNRAIEKANSARCARNLCSVKVKSSNPKLKVPLLLLTTILKQILNLKDRLHGLSEPQQYLNYLILNFHSSRKIGGNMSSFSKLSSSKISVTFYSLIYSQPMYKYDFLLSSILRITNLISLSGSRP